MRRLGRGSIPHCCSTWLSGMETCRGILEGKGESEGEGEGERERGREGERERERERAEEGGMSEGRQTHWGSRERESTDIKILSSNWHSHSHGDIWLTAFRSQLYDSVLYCIVLYWLRSQSCTDGKETVREKLTVSKTSWKTCSVGQWLWVKYCSYGKFSIS